MGYLPIPLGRSVVPRAALVVALAATISACVVVPADRGYRGYGGYRSGSVYGGGPDDYVPAAPPPVQYEVVGVAPYPGWFWINGFWTWRASRHAWVGGHWEAPRRGHRWQPHRWEPIASGRGWREVPGQWQR